MPAPVEQPRLPVLPVGTVADRDHRLLAVAARRFEVAATVEQVGAPGGAELPLLAVAVVRHAEVSLHRQPGEVLVEHEVDHAGHGVGTVSRRGAAGDDVDAADQHLRQRVDVDGAVLVRSGQAVPVEQHQGALCAEVAQRKHVTAVVGAAIALRARSPPADDLRQLVEAVGDVARRRDGHFGGFDGSDRGRRILVVADERARHRDDRA